MGVGITPTLVGHRRGQALLRAGKLAITGPDQAHSTQREQGDVFLVAGQSLDIGVSTLQKFQDRFGVVIPIKGLDNKIASR